MRGFIVNSYQALLLRSFHFSTRLFRNAGVLESGVFFVHRKKLCLHNDDVEVQNGIN